MSPRLRATLALVLVTIIWGWTFVWMKEALDAAARVVPEMSVWTVSSFFLVLRFGLAAALAPLCLPGAVRDLTPGVWRGGVMLGLTTMAGFLLQMLGLGEVSAPVSAFLTSLYVLFTMALMLALRGERPTRSLLLGAVLATFGASYISGPPDVSFGLGELLTVACAVVFAIHILVTDAVTKAHAPLSVTLVAFVVVTALAALSLAGGLALDPGADTTALATLITTPDFYRPLLLAALLATVLAVTLMNTFQRVLPPVRVAVLYALEPVWAASVAYALAGDWPDFWMWLGGSALLAGNLVAELGPVIGRIRLGRTQE